MPPPEKWLIVNYLTPSCRSPHFWCRECGGRGHIDLIDREYMFLTKIVACKPCGGKGLTEKDEIRPGLEHINPSAKPGGKVRGFVDCIPGIDRVGFRRAYAPADENGRVVSDFASGEFDANSNTEVEMHIDRSTME